MIGRIRSALERLFTGERRSIPLSSSAEPDVSHETPRQPTPSEKAHGGDDIDGLPAFLRRKPSQDTSDLPPPSRSERFVNFLQAIESDQAMRTRFAAEPEAVLADLGIDPAPYNLNSPMSPAEVDQLVAAWKNVLLRSRPATPEPTLVEPPQPAPIAVIYGPPPGRSR